LTDVTAGLIDYQITTQDATSTIYSLHSTTHYQMKVRACQIGCGPWSTAVDFSVALPSVPSSAPVISNATVSGGNSLAASWSAVSHADLYQIQVVQPNTGPGGSALTVAAQQISATSVTLPVPVGQASVIVAGCNGDGCGPNSSPVGINPAGPNPSAPNLGTPLGGSQVTGPTVIFSWNRIPGDTGSNTIYRLYVQDESRSTAALDVYTTSSFYGANFKAEGTRYDALVFANPGPSQVAGPAQPFIVHGQSGTGPTMTVPGYASTVPHGNVGVAWTPVPGAGLYQYYVARVGTSVAFQGVTPGLRVQVPLAAVNNVPTAYSAVTRACLTGSNCQASSNTGWGPWSGDPGGGGPTNFNISP
jgi:hypothetical protein